MVRRAWRVSKKSWLKRGIPPIIADMCGAYADSRGASHLHPEVQAKVSDANAIKQTRTTL
jgi:hypothetical protein